MFSIYDNVYPKYCHSYKNISVNEILSLKTIIIELHSNENSYYLMKRLKKRFAFDCKQINKKEIPDLRNAKERYQSFIRKKNKKSVKKIKNNYLSTKNFENSKIADKVDQCKRNKCKDKKTRHVFKSFASSSNVEIFSTMNYNFKILNL